MAPDTGTKRIYCSGPLFSPEEKQAMQQIAEVLEHAGYATFLPQRDGLEAYVMRLANDPRVTNKMFRRINLFTHKAIFALDIYQVVEGCGALVFNMNGRVPDEGGVAETAVAFAVGKPLVIYKQDDRTKFNGYDNSMVSGLAYNFSKVNTIREIPRELAVVMRRVEKWGRTPYSGPNVPPHMAKVLDFGRKIQKFLGLIHFFESPEQEKLQGIERVVDMCESSPDFKELQWA